MRRDPYGVGNVVMRLTHESPRTRWLILLGVWALAAVPLWWHMRLVHDYVAHLDGLAQRVPAAATPLHRSCPSNFMDALTWTRYALALQEGAPWQVRSTDLDNAPAGREVHWNSAFAHAIATAGRVEQWRTGGALPDATERALGWFNFPLLLGLVMLFSAIAARWAGAGAGVVVALGMVGSHDFYSGFVPNYVDHHGLLTAAGFGVALGVIFMGGGWWRADAGDGELLPASRAAARRGAIFSAVCGAVGIWISAATVIPAIAIVGVTAALVGWGGGRAAQAAGAEFDPGAWRLWGRVGAGLCVFFYLLEYAPSHLGLRLEVNHPFHALAWWGGAELVAWLVEWRLADATAKPAWSRLLRSLLAVAVAPATILVFGPKVFIPADPFIVRLTDSVAEGLSQLASWRTYGWAELRQHLNTQLLPLLPAVYLLVRGRSTHRLGLGFAVGATLLFIVMACWKIRWWPNAGGPVIGVLLVALAVLGHRRSAGARWALIIGAAVACYLPDCVDRIGKIRGMVGQHAAQPVDILQPLYRDVAATLRATQPQGDIVLLASPNTSMGVGYYGRFKTIGTLFWENVAGLRSAAEIFSAPTDAEALEKLRARGVTHLALISEQNYLSEFFSLLHPDAPPADYQQTFGVRILYEFRLPIWLRPIPYRIPADVHLPNLVVRLFRITPDQSVPEAYWYLGETELAAGELVDGEAKLQQAIEELPPALRTDQRILAGNACYNYGAHAATVRFYRAALAERATADWVRSLAWILATSVDDRVRNGREALALLERAAPAPGTRDFGYDSNLAAALAETGRFAEAVELATRALDGARAAGDKTAEALNAKRLAAYRAGQPWRQ